MDEYQKWAVLVLLINLATQSRGKNETFITPSSLLENYPTLDQMKFNLLDRRKRSAKDQVPLQSKNPSNLESIDTSMDITAITDYEPQKIDLQKDKGKSVQSSEMPDYKRTSQPTLDKRYHEVPRQKGSTKPPTYGTTRLSKFETTEGSTSISPTLNTKYLDSGNYRTPSPKTRNKFSSVDLSTPTTATYHPPTSSQVYNRISGIQTRVGSNFDTNQSLPESVRPALKNTKTSDKFVFSPDSLSEITKRNRFLKSIASTTIVPNLQTRQSIHFQSQKPVKYADGIIKLHGGISATESTMPIVTLAPKKYAAPPKKRIREQSPELNLEESNQRISLQDKVLHPEDYKFGLLAKYDIKPRPFVSLTKEPLNIVASQVYNRKIEQPQTYLPNPATLRNSNIVVPTLSTTPRSIFPSQKKTNPLNPFTELGTTNFSYSPITLLTPTGSIKPSEKAKSRGPEGFEVLAGETKLEVNKEFPDIRDPATSADKVTSNTELGKYNTDGKFDSQSNDGVDEDHPQGKGLSERYFKEKQDRKPYHNRDGDEDGSKQRIKNRQNFYNGHRKYHNENHKHSDEDEEDHNVSDHSNIHGLGHKYHRDDQDHRPVYNHKDDDDDEEDHWQHYDHSHQNHSSDQDAENTPADDKKHEDHDEKDYNDRDDLRGDDDYNDSNAFVDKLQEKGLAEDHSSNKDDEENRGEYTHKHEQKYDHKKGPGGDHNHKVEAGAEHEEEHHSEDGDEGDKGYESWNKNEKEDKGHRDKEHHDHHYDEDKGEKKKHEGEDRYQKEHHFEEEGGKDAEFHEKGKHKSGHSTKGHHQIHKKDEYAKKTEFFDEFHDDGDSEKEGEFHHEHESDKGGHHKSGHHDKGHEEKDHGKKHHYMKGHHNKEDKGHKKDESHEHHHHHEKKHGKKGGHDERKKWAHGK